MKSLYVEGHSRLHRLPARLKLFVLAILGVGIFLTDDLLVLVAFGAVAVLIFASIGLPLRAALAMLRPVFITILIVAIFSLAFNPWQEALMTLLRLTTLMVFAAAVTATTKVTDFIDEITRLAYPLEKIGLLRASDVGLAIGLVIRFVPDILTRYEAIRDAHTARGLRLRPLSLLVPLIILTLKDADNVASAIDARRIRRHAVTKNKEEN
ncbi:energy-coupling factor transporter transmembrane component T family protein [Oryzifoliimicrobium ureilyticus]|uniref:energy-coupling factor transporter transmembrane component T family protein n=1 Tax=Oryzifoliimicrobium ureilyticus TaxID=3113724 RepID=UPI0030765E8D